MFQRITLFIILGFSFLVANTINFAPQESYANGYRIVINPIIKDDMGIYEARLYFKKDKAPNFQFFSTMRCKDNSCKGEIPIVEKRTKSIEYCIVYQNNAGKVYNTEIFKINERELLELPEWQTFKNDRLTLKTEMFKIPKKVYGFDDKVRIEAVDNSEKIGVIANLLTQDMVGVENIKDILGSYGGVIYVKRPNKHKFENQFETTVVDILKGAVAMKFLLPLI